MTTPDGTVLAFATFMGNEKIRARISGADREAPKGATTYNNRSKKLQQKLIARWSALHSSKRLPSEGKRRILRLRF